MLTMKNFTEELRLGWNLGNTFDAPHGETTWGNPVTTKAMFEKLKELGFKTVRLPVSWNCHVGNYPKYTIDIPWLDRIQQVVDWILECDMYCIINCHHDDRMFIPHYGEESDRAKAYLTGIWSQCCERFKDYDERLIFECMNEPRELRTPIEWHLTDGDPHCMELADCINQYNQLFVDVVRADPNLNNKNRFLLVPSYDAAPLHAIPDYYIFPTDPMNRTVQSIHAYTPYNLCLNYQSEVAVLDDESKKDIDFFMIGIHKKFDSKGIPVVIGETQIHDKKNPEVRREWCKYFFSLARQYGMMCCLWDQGQGSMSFLDRRNLKVHPDAECLLEGMLAGLEEDVKGVLEYK